MKVSNVIVTVLFTLCAVQVNDVQSWSIKSFRKTIRKCMRYVNYGITEASSEVAELLFDLEECGSAPASKYRYDGQLASRLMLYSSAAYVVDSDRLRNWSCDLCRRSLTDFHPHPHQSVTQDSHDLKVLSFVGYDKNIGPDGAIVLAFRGTTTEFEEGTDYENWKTNFDFFPVELPDEMVRDPDTAWSGKVHNGFLEAYMALRNNVSRNVRELMATFPHANLMITGHSLGGALGTLAATDLSDLKPTVYTFGSPRVGSECFSRYYDLNVPNTVRVVHEADLVTRLPVEGMGFDHVQKRIIDSCCNNSHVVYLNTTLSSK